MRKTSSRSAWWREPMMWLVIGGPMTVVAASLATAAIAWSGADKVVSQPPAQRPEASLAPAVKARNHAATAQPLP